LSKLELYPRDGEFRRIHHRDGGKCQQKRANQLTEPEKSKSRHLPADFTQVMSHAATNDNKSKARRLSAGHSNRQERDRLGCRKRSNTAISRFSLRWPFRSPCFPVCISPALLSRDIFRSPCVAQPQFPKESFAASFPDCHVGYTRFPHITRPADLTGHLFSGVHSLCSVGESFGEHNAT
jgi:hypothetical protein